MKESNVLILNRMISNLKYDASTLDKKADAFGETGNRAMEDFLKGKALEMKQMATALEFVAKDEAV